MTTRWSTPWASSSEAAACRASCTRASWLPAALSRVFHSSQSAWFPIGRPFGWPRAVGWRPAAGMGWESHNPEVRSLMRTAGPAGFDLDLNLINSRPAIMAAWSAVAEELGVRIDLDDETAGWASSSRTKSRTGFAAPDHHDPPPLSSPAASNRACRPRSRPRCAPGAPATSALPPRSARVVIPAGYATMVVAALTTPPWRRVMDPEVLAHYGGDLSLANIHPRAAAAAAALPAVGPGRQRRDRLTRPCRPESRAECQAGVPSTGTS